MFLFFSLLWIFPMAISLCVKDFLFLYVIPLHSKTKTHQMKCTFGRVCGRCQFKNTDFYFHAKNKLFWGGLCWLRNSNKKNHFTHCLYLAVFFSKWISTFPLKHKQPSNNKKSDEHANIKINKWLHTFV